MMKRFSSTRFRRGSALIAALCLFSAATACSKSDDDGGSGGDGDGDGDGGSGGDSESCTVEDNEDGTATISCPDGSEVTVSTQTPGEVTTCTVEDNEDGTATIGCPDGSEVEVSTTPADEIETCMAVTDGNLVTVSCPDGTTFTSEITSTVDARFLMQTDFSLQLYEVSGGKSTMMPVSAPLGADESFVSYVTSADNTKVLFAVSDADDVTNLYMVDVSGEPTEPVMLNDDLGPNGDVSSFSFSPDGNWVVYMADPDENDQLKLFVVDVSGSDPEEPVEVSGNLTVDSDVNNYSYSPDSAKLAFTADPTEGVDELFLVDLSDPDDGERVNGSLSGGQFVSDGLYAFSADSNWLFYMSDEETEGHREIFVADVSDGTPGNPEVVSETEDTTTINAYWLSPDSNWLVYRANDDDAATYDLYLVDLADVGSAGDLYDQEVDVTHGNLAWSGDSRHVVWTSDLEDPGENMQLLSVDINDGNPEDPEVLNQELPDFANVNTFTLNHEGTWVAYLVDATIDGKDELFVVSPDGSDGPEQMSAMDSNPDGVQSFNWAQSANVLRYLAADDNSFYDHALIDLSDGLPGERLNPQVLEISPFEFGVSEDGTVAYQTGYLMGTVLTDWSGLNLQAAPPTFYPIEFLH